MDDKQNIIIYRTSDGRASVALYAKDGKIWLNQQQMAELFATSKQLISHHIANILKDKELDGFSVVKQYLTTAADGKNDVTRDEVNLSVVSNFLGSLQFHPAPLLYTLNSPLSTLNFIHPAALPTYCFRFRFGFRLNNAVV